MDFSCVIVFQTQNNMRMFSGYGGRYSNYSWTVGYVYWSMINIPGRYLMVFAWDFLVEEVLDAVRPGNKHDYEQISYTWVTYFRKCIFRGQNSDSDHSLIN